MRKKSHISLARYIVKNTENKALENHKFAFYLGSILPDCKPSFLYQKHEINGTFPMVEKEILKLAGEGERHKNQRQYYRNLGQVTHYLADYFTFPHNKIYPGTIKDHCSYEETLKLKMREYLKKEAADKKAPGINFATPEEILTFIKNTHADYLQRKHDVESDIAEIVRVNRQAVAGIMAFLSREEQKLQVVFDKR